MALSDPRIADLLVAGVLNANGADADRLCYINAHYSAHLDSLDHDALTLYQSFKPDADALSRHGYKANPSEPPDGPNDDATCDRAFIIGSKNAAETRYHIALAMRILKPSGYIHIAAGNQEGGSRLSGYLKQIGCTDIHSESKHKARSVNAVKPVSGAMRDDVLALWASEGAKQNIMDGAYLSQPGIFGWDKIDQGSAMLISCLPDNMKGHMADFGCGYGYLTRSILDHHPKVKSMIAIDADYRAVQACTDNLKEAHKDRFETRWEDLSRPVSDFKPLDTIIMNPPFHTGKRTDTSLGQAFIENAARALKPRGTLYMVANAHLPYEVILEKQFFRVTKLKEKNGFKVFQAEK